MDRRTEELDRLFYEEKDMNVVFQSLYENAKIGSADENSLCPPPLPPKKCYPKKGIYTFYKNPPSRELFCVWRGFGFTAAVDIFSTSIPENFIIGSIRIIGYRRNGSIYTKGTYAQSIPRTSSIWDEILNLLIANGGYDPTGREDSFLP